MSWRHPLGFLPTMMDSDPATYATATTTTCRSLKVAAPWGLPWPENADGAYEAACVACEIQITLTMDDHSVVCSFLTDFDKRYQSALGCALPRELLLNGVQLKKGDRLDQSIKVPDTGDAVDKLDASCFPL